MADDTSVGELNAKYGQSAGRAKVSFESGQGGLTKVVLTSGVGSKCEMYLLGATITSYVTPPLTAGGTGGREAIFVSPKAKYELNKAIRGGVPIIFPWFGNPSFGEITGRKDLPPHGFARTSVWTVERSDITPAGEAVTTLVLQDNAETRKVWNHAFLLRFTVVVGKTLTFSLTAENRDNSAFTFEDALHTYFTVSDVRRISITGLDDVDYIDKFDNFAVKHQAKEPLVLTGPTDRVYLNTTGTCVIHDPAGHTTTVGKRGSRCTVVWNPWEHNAEKMGDLSGGVWPGFVCVEAANCAEHKITLGPGSSHTTACEIG